MFNNMLKKFFSVTNNNIHVVIKIFGIKIKLLNAKFLEQKYFEHKDIISKYESQTKLSEPKCLKYDELISKYELKPERYKPHVCDWFGSFKAYCYENNAKDKIEKLKKNLDEDSIKTVDLFLKRVRFLPDSSYMNDYIMSKRLLNLLSTEEDKRIEKEYKEQLSEYKKEFNMLKFAYLPETFYFHNGLKFCNEKMREYVRNKDFIDAGAFVGDSVLVFEKYYSPRKTYSFEISQKTVENYYKIMELNNIPEDRFEVIQKGVLDSESVIKFSDTSNEGTTLASGGGGLSLMRLRQQV